MTRRVAREVARWARAVVLPAAALTAAVTLHLVATQVATALPARAAWVVWRAALGASAAWLVVSIARAALQPRRDRRAAEHLQDMRVRAGLPDHALLCILRALWSTPAGERVSAVDVRTGVTQELWLAESSLAPGAYALASFGWGAAWLIDVATPTEVLTAGRHDSRSGRDGTTTQCRARATFRERRAAADVVRAAEALTR